MLTVTLDFETYWSDTHTLSKMLPMVYVTHPDTEVISCSFKFGDEPAFVAVGEDAVREVFESRREEISRSRLVAHNMSGFDSMIAAWRFKARPAMWACTLAMARPIHSVEVGGSLAKLAAHYGVGVKDKSALLSTKGKHLSDMTAEEIAAMRAYNCADTEMCRALFDKLLPHFTEQEMWHIDATIRQLIFPKFVLDTALLTDALLAERQAKHDALKVVADNLGVGVEDVQTVLASAPKFAAFLVSRGVEVPTKQSPSNPEKRIPALARTDEAFLALAEHDDALVAAATRARLSVKSTLLETRIQTLLEVGAACAGRLPVPIHYCGASTTGRDSGWAYNCQNFPRVDSSKPKRSDALRRSLLAPPGHAIVVADLSGIELRVNLTLWAVPYAVELLKQDPEADLYKPLASEVLGVPIEGMPKMVRQAGKAMHLGCGYGLGSPAKYRAVARQLAGLDVSEEDAAIHISGYRRKHPEVVRGWKVCHAALDAIFSGAEQQVDPWGLVHTCKDGLVLPSGRLIRYHNLRKMRRDDGRVEWVYGKDATRIYAGKVTENIVQALARDILKEMKRQVFDATGHRSVLDVHDELVYIVPEKDAQRHLDTVQGIMRQRRSWWPDLVTWSEGSIAYNYGDAK